MDVNVVFLGCGNIGRGVYRLLTEYRQDIAHRTGLRFVVKKMLVRDVNKPRGGVPPELLSDDIGQVLSVPDVKLVCEFIGGEEPARDYLLRALSMGKTVITANKEVVSKRWPELEAAAKKTGAGLYFEASVCGGIPIIRTLWDSMQGNNISRLLGIVNGTTNYILTRMTEEGVDYPAALHEAQRLGYAEPDPTSDITGLDAAYKLSILSSMAFHARIPLNEIYCEGIDRITAADIAYAHELGFVCKLLAIGKKNRPVVDARVHPAFIPVDHPLASVRGPFNAVFLSGNAVGDLMLYGRGAGDLPTASAIVSDLCVAATRAGHQYATFQNTADKDEDLIIQRDWESEYFIHIVAADKPGVLSNVAGLLAKHEVSLASVIQKNHGQPEVPVIFVTHKAHEKAMSRAIGQISVLPEVKSVVNVIRVER